MPAELSSPPISAPRDAEPMIVAGEVRCALTGRALRAEEAYWAPPLITVGQLLATVGQTLLRRPGELGQLLMGEQPNVPYDPEARQELASRRTAEQLKLIGLLLLIAALLVVPIMLLVA